MMSLLERIANRLGFYRPAATEIIVFRNHEAAREAGFKGAIHWKHPHLRAWWPGQGAMGLACRPAQRVTVPSDMLRMPVGGEGALGDLLRKRQMVFGHDALWVAL